LNVASALVANLDMEEELRCPFCKQLFVNPVLLPCYHALCMTCAIELQTPSSATAASTTATVVTAAQIHHTSSVHLHQQHSQSSSSSVSTTGSATESVSSDQDQADKVSILSEADSGVICTLSRPGSYAGTPNLQGLLFPPSGGSSSVYSLACPLCRKIVFFDETGVRNLPQYRAMESIIDRFCEREALRCQMCETDPKVAAVVCEQCEIRYCDGCLSCCHPSRGPLANHSLVKPRGASQLRDSLCLDHTDQFSMFCLGCKIPLCNQCLTDNRHQSHDIQPISAMCKAQKVGRERANFLMKHFFFHLS
jgi:tripartite motif-containing protein 9/67